MENHKLNSFSGILGAVIVSISSAVGLGNIWKFPTMTGINGGAIFIFIYILSCIFITLPVMISEFYIGHKARAGAVHSFKVILPGTKWYLIGHLGIVAALLITAFYTDVIGWVFAYFFQSITGNVLTSDVSVATDNFNKIVSSPSLSLLFQSSVFITIAIILLLGVSKGIERVVKFSLPLLAVMLITLAINSLTLSNAREGLKFLFMPDFSKFTINVVLMAMGLAFFKLSVGMAIMQTYASYFPEKISLPNTAIKVMFADLFISLTAGIAIFPAVFTYGFEPNSGPGLIFITMPVVFSNIPGGKIFVSLFFLLCSAASLGAILSITEGVVSYLEKSWNFPRKISVIFATVLFMLVGSLATLSMTPVLDDIKIFGKNFFDLFDFISSNICMPLGGILTCILVGRYLNENDVKTYIMDSGTKNRRIVDVWYFLVKYITPILIILVFLSSLGLLS